MVDRGCSQNGFARLTGSTFTSAGSTVSACLRQAGVAFSHGKSQGRNDREQKTSSTQIVSRRIRKPIGEQLIQSAIPENLRPAMIINSKSSSTDAVPRKVSEDFRGTLSLPLGPMLPPATAKEKVSQFHGDFRARSSSIDFVPRKVSADLPGNMFNTIGTHASACYAKGKVSLFHGDFRARNLNKTNSIVHRPLCAL